MNILENSTAYSRISGKTPPPLQDPKKKKKNRTHHKLYFLISEKAETHAYLK